jgi:hypothetical protein
VSDPKNIATFSRELLNDPEYVENLVQRLKRGEAPQILSLLRAYARGVNPDASAHAQKVLMAAELTWDSDDARG